MGLQGLELSGSGVKGCRALGLWGLGIFCSDLVRGDHGLQGYLGVC